MNKKNVHLLTSIIVFSLTIFSHAENYKVLSLHNGVGEIDSFYPNEKLYIKNNSNYDGTMIAALYDHSNRLKQLYVQDTQTTSSIPVDAGEVLAGDEIKAFLLSDIETLQPKTQALTVQSAIQDDTFVHPIMERKYTQSQVTTLMADVAGIMSLSNEAIQNIIPKQSTSIQEVKNPVTGELIQGQWDYLDPDHITDAATGTKFPNDNYLNNATETFLNIYGKSIVISYCQSGEEKYYFNALIDFYKNQWLSDQIVKLANLYSLTGESVYAEKTAYILYQWSLYRKDYLIVKDGAYISTGGVGLENGEPMNSGLPYNWYAHRSAKRWCNEISYEILAAYDLTFNSSVYDQLSSQLNINVRTAIEEDLIQEMADFTLMVPWHRQITTNLVNHIRGWIYVGRVTESPDYVHYAYKYIQDVVTNFSFTRDGIFGEGTSYASTFFTTLGDVFTPFEGYSDPPGYTSDVTNLHLEDPLNDLQKERDFLENSKLSLYDIAYPTGSAPHMHDTYGYQLMLDPFSSPGWWEEPLAQSVNALKDGFGHAVLGGGSGGKQIQTQLHFSDDNFNHSHRDALNLTVNAFGRTMLDDIGYNLTNYRQWSAMSLSHNTVVVDRMNQNGVNSKGNVLMYFDDAQAPMIQVDGRNAYENNVDTFKRTLAQNHIDADHPYIIDIFEVEGGSMHDYVLHGTRVGEQEIITDVSTVSLPQARPLLLSTEQWSEPSNMYSPIAGNGYGVFTDVSEENLTDNFFVDYRYIDPYCEGAIYDERMSRDSENYALNAQVSMDGTYFDAYPPANAVDGNPSTRVAFRAKPWTMTIDLGETKAFNQLVINMMSAVNATEYDILVSADGTLYETIATQDTFGNLQDGINELNFATTQVRYIKINILTAAKTPSIYEVEAYYVAPPYRDGENLSFNKSVLDNYHFDAYPPEKAVDGDSSTRWAARGAAPWFLSVDLGEETDINAVNLITLRDIDNYNIEVSSDNITWTRVADDERNGLIRQMDSAEFEILFPQIKARYVRMNILGTPDGKTPSIYEFKVYYKSALGIRTHYILNDSDLNNKLLIGKTPSLKENPNELTDQKSLVTIWRREQSSASISDSSKFIAVHEPYYETRAITNIEKMEVEGTDSAVALKITLDSRTDIVFLALNSGGVYEFTDGTNIYQTNGRYALISDNGTDVQYKLFGGTYIKKNSAVVYSQEQGTYTGTVLSIGSQYHGDPMNFIEVSETLPQDLTGRYIILNFGNCSGQHSVLGDSSYSKNNITSVYKIKSIINEDNASMIETEEETGIVQDGQQYKEIFAQRRIFGNNVSYTIY